MKLIKRRVYLREFQNLTYIQRLSYVIFNRLETPYGFIKKIKFVVLYPLLIFLCLIEAHLIKTRYVGSRKDVFFKEVKILEERIRICN